MSRKEGTTKKVMVKVTEKAVGKLANFYSGMMCFGRWYEPKMPEKLKK